MSREAWFDTDHYDPELLLTEDQLEAKISEEVKSPEVQALLRELLMAVEETPGLTDDWCERPTKIDPEVGEIEIDDDEELYELANNEGLCEKPVPATCMMCALGNLARKKDMGTYGPLVDDLDYGHSHGSVEMAELMGFPELVAREIIELHNGPNDWTPEKRKARLVKWIKSKLVPA
jgi:hypothetical protein